MKNKKFDINLIVAISLNHCIGKNGGIPFHSSKDLKHFKEITMGNVLIMGRRTFESLPPSKLPGRDKIVISSNPYYKPVLPNGEKVVVVPSLEEAIKLYNAWHFHEGGLKPCKSLFIIGGGMVYKEALDKGLVDRIYLTIINQEVQDGDTFFPVLDQNIWDIVDEEFFADGFFQILEKNN